MSNNNISCHFYSAVSHWQGWAHALYKINNNAYIKTSKIIMLYYIVIILYSSCTTHERAHTHTQVHRRNVTRSGVGWGLRRLTCLCRWVFHTVLKASMCLCAPACVGSCLPTLLSPAWSWKCLSPFQSSSDPFSVDGDCFVYTCIVFVEIYVLLLTFMKKWVNVVISIGLRGWFGGQPGCGQNYKKTFCKQFLWNRKCNKCQTLHYACHSIQRARRVHTSFNKQGHMIVK